MATLPPDWRVVNGDVSAWFDAPSLIDSAALAGRIAELPADLSIDVRPNGVRVRLDSDRHADSVSAAARELGVGADPRVLQEIGAVVETAAPGRIVSFWQQALGYDTTDAGGLVDPLRRDPALRVEASSELRPLRNRIHLDVVRPAAVVEQIDLGAASGPYGVCHADLDGNEVDLVPVGALGESHATADWQTVFGAVACYRTALPAQQRDVATAAAALAHEAGFPLLIDLRPGLVILDTGKDLWEADAHGLDVDFEELAAEVQAAARGLGANPEPGLSRFVQLFLDAADVEVVRAFWAAALGYVHDRRAGVTDIHDPRRLNPELVFQPLDGSDTERRRQRNRIHIELAVPSDAAPDRVATALAAGGQLLEQCDGRWRIADPELNELVIVCDS